MNSILHDMVYCDIISHDVIYHDVPQLLKGFQITRCILLPWRVASLTTFISILISIFISNIQSFILSFLPYPLGRWSTTATIWKLRDPPKPKLQPGKCSVCYLYSLLHPSSSLTRILSFIFHPFIHSVHPSYYPVYFFLVSALLSFFLFL